MENSRALKKAVDFISIVLCFTNMNSSAGEISNNAIASQSAAHRPNIILIMTDDQGWGQTGYYLHPILKTPNLDEMASNGLRFDRFYASAPVCSPTRASVLTGRTNDRTGVPDHGYALRLQEKTLPAALKASGYVTGHFGKWHLSALRGPGVPVLGNDTHGPGAFGFDEWLSVTNYFDVNPIMSSKGVFKEYKGDTSTIIINGAMTFIRASIKRNKPFFAVIWDAAPHAPWKASDSDRRSFGQLDIKSQHHYGELVAFDRSIGTLRNSLRDLGIADNTLIWFMSDNGGLSGIIPDTVGGLRGYKGSLQEGGIRVPGIIEWPAVIKPRITDYPASSMDIFPTIGEILDLPETAFLDPIDGVSLYPLFDQNISKREKPIPFLFRGKGAIIDNNYKLVTEDVKNEKYVLFDLSTDHKELKDISASNPEIFRKMKVTFKNWKSTVDESVVGKDYQERRVHANQPKRRFWRNDTRYKPFFEMLKKRPAYNDFLKNR